MQAVVIGSGLSGLTAGAKLAQEGVKVTVFEQFERTGGVTAPLEADGFHALTIYTICPDTLAEGTWQEKKETYAHKLIAYAEELIPGLAEHTRLRVILTPEDFRNRTHLDHHAFGGIAPLIGKSGISHKTPVEGLWFVGQQSQSGGGVNAVIPAAFRTAQDILAG